jgi:hypothetical protein
MVTKYDYDRGKGYEVNYGKQDIQCSLSFSLTVLFSLFANHSLCKLL